MQTPASSLCISSAIIQNTVDVLRNQQNVNEYFAVMGVDLFYHILTFLTEENINFMPAKQLFMTCLEQLGQVSNSMNNYSLNL